MQPRAQPDSGRAAPLWGYVGVTVQLEKRSGTIPWGKTVEHHRSHILEKLGMRDRV